MTQEALKRIRSILSAVTGLEDDDDEYIGDARKAVEQLIDKLEAQPQRTNERVQAFQEIAAKIESMPFNDDTMASLVLWLKDQA